MIVYKNINFYGQILVSMSGINGRLGHKINLFGWRFIIVDHQAKAKFKIDINNHWSINVTSGWFNI